MMSCLKMKVIAEGPDKVALRMSREVWLSKLLGS